MFNDIAVSAAYALTHGRVARVLVIDLDVHQGNGTAEIFQDDDRVVTFDMFCDSKCAVLLLWWAGALRTAAAAVKR